MLMHHFAEHTVHIMQPIFHERNPWKTIYLPLAREGHAHIEKATDPDGAAAASVAVFHSLLSTTAIDLQSQLFDNNGLRAIAGHHRQRALIALQSALAIQASSYKDLMTAILSLVSMDVSIF
jgi:arginine metabolism regulation protein II